MTKNIKYVIVYKRGVPMDLKKLLIENFSDEKQIILNNFKSVIDDIVLEYFEYKEMFENKDISTYYFDEFKFRTNVCLDTCATLYLEINQLSNIKSFKPNAVVQDRYLTLKKIKDDIMDKSVEFFDSNTLIWQDKYSVNYAINVYDDDDNKVTHYFRVIPCFTQTNENNTSGVVYYTNDKVLVEQEFPKISIRNFKMKNRATNDLYRQYVLLFKNAYKLEKNEKNLPFEIFEILLYNVPDSYFTDFEINTINKILNYIKSCGIAISKTIDQQQDAFKSKYKSLSSLYASMVIKTLIKLFSNKK